MMQVCMYMSGQKEDSGKQESKDHMVIVLDIDGILQLQSSQKRLDHDLHTTIKGKTDNRVCSVTGRQNIPGRVKSGNIWMHIRKLNGLS